MKTMKKVLMTMVVVVVLMGMVPNIALAGGWGSWGSVLGNNGGYGGYGYGGDRSVGRAAVAIFGAVKIVETISDVRIQDRGMKVIEKEQDFQHEQSRRDQQIQQNPNVIYGVRIHKQKAGNQQAQKRIRELEERIQKLESQLKNQKSQTSVQQPYLKIIPIDKNSLKYILVDPNDPQKGVKIVPK